MENQSKFFQCPACGACNIADEWIAYCIENTKKILWCENCGFGWQHPLPSPKEISDYYENYPVYNIHGANEKEDSCRKRIRRIDNLCPKRGRLLDIGSGLGYFLKIAKEDGWDVTGIEPQVNAAAFCRESLKIDVYTGYIKDIKIDQASFDVVTLWDVWEHVHDPLKFLENCISLIAPEGLLCISIPNASGLPAKLFKGNWRYVMKTHLNYFSLDYVKRTMDDFSIIIERMDHTIKIQSLLQGFSAWLPLKIDTESIIRLGRKGSIEEGRPEQKKSLAYNSGLSDYLNFFRRLVLKVNLMRLPFSSGDLMDIYCKKKS